MIHTLQFILLLLWTAVNGVCGAGVATHLYIAFKVQYTLPATIGHNLSDYYAGSFFPDAFYNCFGESELAETAHWPPFLKSAVDYYHEEYVNKGKQNNELKSFIYGMFTHQLADVAWHSLKSNQGLLKVISEIDFNGDIDLAHTYLDTSGDFILLNKQFQNLSPDVHDSLLQSLQSKWNYPIDDVVNIFHKHGFKSASKFKLQICMERGYSALQGEISTLLSERATGEWLSKKLTISPFTYTILGDYYYGGLDQIISTLNTCISELTTWFEGSPNSEPWMICQPAFGKKSKGEVLESIMNNQVMNTQLRTWESNERMYLSTGISNSKFGTSLVTGMFLGEETLVVSAPYEDENGSIYMISIRDIVRNQALPQNVYTLNTLKVGTEIMDYNQGLKYPLRFGNQLYTWKLMDIEVLVVSEPGRSTFSLYLKNKKVANLSINNRNEDFIGTKGMKQWTLLSKENHDIDNDQFYDLVIGSMYSDDTDGYEQSGVVAVISGSRVYDILVRQSNTDDTNILDIKIEDVKLLEYKLPTELKLDHSYEQFGTTFASTESFSLIGVNSYGAVLVFEKHTGKYHGFVNDNSISSKDTNSHLQKKTTKEGNLFGFHNIVTGFFNDIEWVAISSTAYSYDETCPLCGAVYLYTIENQDLKLKTIIKPKMLKSERPNQLFNSLFGSSILKVGMGKILVGSPGYLDGRGGLYIFDISSFVDIESHQRYGEADLIMLGDGGVGFSNFGGNDMSLMTIENNQFLLIGMADFLFSQNPGSLTSTGAVAIIQLI